MKELIFECEVRTPMFIAGAETKQAELRAPSLKGALRFWWRAVNGHLTITELAIRETEIFGGGGEDARKSSFSLAIETTAIPSTKDLPSHKEKTTHFNRRTQQKQEITFNILNYLAFGPAEYVDKQTKITKEYFPETSKFRVIFSSFALEEKSVSLLTDLMYFVAWFGGLGSKSRNGYGRFEITSIKLDGVENQKPYKEPYDLYVKYVEKCTGGLKSYTAFSKETDLIEYKNDYRTWDEALAAVGKSYRKARLSLEDPHTYRRRQYIAAPLQAGRNHATLERHSKAFFLSVYRFNGHYKSIVLYMPYEYCKKNDKIQNKAKALEEYLSANKQLHEKL